MPLNIDIFECKMVLITKLKENQSFEQYLHSSLFAIKASFVGTGGPLLTQKSLTRFLAYVHASEGFLRSQGTPYSPTNTNFM